MQTIEINGFVIDEFNQHKLEEGKKQGDEIGVGNQPALMVFVFFCALLSRHAFVLVVAIT